MIAAFLLPYPVRGFRAPYLWVLYKLVSSFDEPMLFLMGGDYLRSPGAWQAEGRWEMRAGAQERLRYRIPSAEELSRHHYHLFPAELFDDLLAESGGNPIAVFKRLLCERVARVEAVIAAGLARFPAADVEAVLTWCNCPSLNAVADELGIPVVHLEMGPLRSPLFRPTAYLDFRGVNGNTEAEARYRRFLLDREGSPSPQPSPPLCGGEGVREPSACRGGEAVREPSASRGGEGVRESSACRGGEGAWEPSALREGAEVRDPSPPAGGRGQGEGGDGVFPFARLDALRDFFLCVDVQRSQEQCYDHGIALQVEDDSNLIAFGNGFDNQALLAYARLHAAGRVLVRAHPGSLFSSRSDWYEVDHSPDSIRFVLNCRRLLTTNSSVGLEAVLFGVPVTALGDCSYRYILAADGAERVARLAFYLFAYLVPGELIYDSDYLRFRLRNPGEDEIVARHVCAYLGRNTMTGSVEGLIETALREGRQVTWVLSSVACK